MASSKKCNKQTGNVAAEGEGAAAAVPAVQFKLAVGAVNDPLETEADAVADQVMRMSAPVSSAVHTTADGGAIQRKCDHCEEEEKVQRKPLASSITPFIQTKGGEGGTVSDGVSSRINASRGSGSSMDSSTQSFMESRFGTDFSGVKIHTDSEAVQLSRELNAQAFTVGNDIYFNSGQYEPGSESGKHLLAHELTHTVQQGGAASHEAVQMKNCSAVRTCALPDACAKTDAGAVPKTSVASTSWSLTINVDIERGDWESALRNTELGHTHVRFAESNGDEYSYGFYPKAAVPNENVRSVPGCVNHPDTSHDACTDRAVTFSLTKAEYTKALSFAQSICSAGHYYGIDASGTSYTCTTYANDVVKASGKSIPSSSSKPTTIFYQPVPSVDNPNTLIENMEKQGVGVGKSAGDVTAFINSSKDALLEVMTKQEKVRLLTAILNAWYINETDMKAMERLCSKVMTSAEMSFIRTAITPLIVPKMTDIGQRTRLRLALARL